MVGVQAEEVRRVVVVVVVVVGVVRRRHWGWVGVDG